MTSEHVVPLCALIVSVMAFCISIITILINLRQKKLDNLLSLHQFLHQGDLSDARRKIREQECEVSLKDPSVRRVCSSFDYAGTMVRNGVVNRKLFFHYWATPLRTLDGPLNSIANSQTGDRVTVKDYYKDLWWLLQQAKMQTPRS